MKTESQAVSEKYSHSWNERKNKTPIGETILKDGSNMIEKKLMNYMTILRNWQRIHHKEQNKG